MKQVSESKPSGKNFPPDLIIDLCCGYGRFTDNEVSIDIDRKVKPTIIADIRYLPLKPGLKPKLCHACPPCTYFSYNRLCQGKGYDCLGVATGLDLVSACFRAFDYLQPGDVDFREPSRFA